MLKNIILSIGTAASIISLATVNIPTWGKCIIVILGLICLGYMIYDDYTNQKERLIVCKSEMETRQYMHEWIRSQGKVCIMTRDLSWVDSDIEETMIRKRDSMTIFAQKETELTKRLKSAGVTIHYYGGLGFEPQSRFTIIRYNRPDKQIAIANTKNTLSKKRKYHHTIYQTEANGDMKDGWILSLADDLIKLCDSACAIKDQETE